MSELFDDCKSGEGLKEVSSRLVPTSDISNCDEKNSDGNSSAGQPWRKNRWNHFG